ncbi:hypothetical protein JQ035_09855 [Clostridium botulinum]|nr:hypothetical protein [Clostridium botulinum]
MRRARWPNCTSSYYLEFSFNATILENRLTSFLHPEADELNTGLQLVQSKIGIGSGGF